MNSGKPDKIMRYFRYRKLMEMYGAITKKTLLAEFGRLSPSTLKKYVGELEPMNEKKPRSYRLSHKAKLELSVIELQ
jgi:hypothetical protein